MVNRQSLTREANVLIVEGSSSNVQMLSMILKQKGYHVRTALSGEAAIKIVRENQPDIIFLEANICDMDGYQVCKILKSDEMLNKIPIIFINTYNGKFDKIKLFAVGGVDYIDMPYNDKEVLTHIDTHLKLQFMQRFNEELNNTNIKLGNQVQECNQQLEETTAALKEFNIMLEEEISERTKREEEIIYLSYHDQLTGLYNRRFYREELERLDIERNLPITLVMGDVNGLKLINDSFGHVLGDELLKKVAEVMRSGCRADDIIVRLGGDEFVIILPKTDVSEAEKIIKHIKALLLKEKLESIDISVSFGWETKNNAEEKVEEIFKNAEDNMYKRKLVESPRLRENTISAINSALHEKSKR